VGTACAQNWLQIKAGVPETLRKSIEKRSGTLVDSYRVAEAKDRW
jgi:hypothetical protein